MIADKLIVFTIAFDIKILLFNIRHKSEFALHVVYT